MIGRIAGALALILGLGLFAAPSPADAAPSSANVPGGSYLESCKYVQYDPDTATVHAACNRGSGGIFGEGEPVVRQYDVAGCKAGTIWNDHGDLYCIAEQPWGHGRVIPNGSYINSCSARRVENNVLIAECGKSGSGTRYSSLNLLNCDWSQDISNQNGNLSCVPGSTPAVEPKKFMPIDLISAPPPTPILRPVQVAPAVESMSTVVPADEPGSTGEADEKEQAGEKTGKKERKRKKRRHGPGERG